MPTKPRRYLWLPISEIPEIPGKPFIRRSVGANTKLSVGEFICLLFHYNEELDYAHKRNDEQLRDILLKEFGHRKGFAKLAARKENVGYYRSLYNRGTITRRRVINKIASVESVTKINPEAIPGNPKSQWFKSYRYDSAGNIINPRNGEPYADQGDIRREIEETKDKQPNPSGKDPLKAKRKKSNRKNSRGTKKAGRGSVENGTLE